ncbi:MAG TPA: hypothetical protein VIM11_26740 [Tepidisphaeraceae bacterium]
MTVVEPEGIVTDDPNAQVGVPTVVQYPPAPPPPDAPPPPPATASNCAENDPVQASVPPVVKVMIVLEPEAVCVPPVQVAPPPLDAGVPGPGKIKPPASCADAAPISSENKSARPSRFIARPAS